MAGKSKKKVKIYNTKKKNKSENTIIEELQARYETIDEAKVKSFSNMPLSSHTQRGLKENGFLVPTDIQRQSIGLALRGFDILGAAKTGSGKTLAFLIPVLEILYCKQWTRLDRIGALIITPTRELAYQIYETLRKIGRYHDFSAALIIGGKDLQFEKKRMDQCNIIICTPGRLLQHMDENPLFDAVNMQILVLDEADRCLDMGFEQAMNCIIENLPPKRQTLLFSATQTKSVRDLARLSLRDPMYVSVHEHAAHTTPEGLQQSYVVCNLEDKMALLWSFIRNHLKQKILIFYSSCKQVKYAYEAFCRLRPGVSLLALYGTLHQLKRMAIYESFCKKQHAVLFATDIAARGLDFPAVNWVVQMDCPEDTNAYIHRAGRTARFESGGESLLVLLPSELEIINQLQARKIPINVIKVNPNKLQSPQRKMEALLARDTALKETAQRSFVAYVKSVFLMKDKKIFDVHSLDTDAYAKSLGLAVPPRIRFLQKMKKAAERGTSENNVKRNSKSVTGKKLDSGKDGTGYHGNEEDSDSGDSDDSTEYDKDVTRYDRDKKQSGWKTESQSSAHFGNVDSDDDDDILKIKRRDVHIEDNLPEDDTEAQDDSHVNKKKAITKAAIAKKILKKKIIANKKTIFTEEGEEVMDSAKSRVSEMAREYEKEAVSGIDIERAKVVLREEDHFDKQRFREKVKAKHREQKKKLKTKMKKNDEDLDDENEDVEVRLANSDDSSDDGSEPDLSWLPDPDKIYGKEGNNTSDESESDTEKGESSRRPLKRKLPPQDKQTTGKIKRKLEERSSLTLMEDEELALKLLEKC